MSIQFRCQCGTMLTAQRDAQATSICCPACLVMVPIPDDPAEQHASAVGEFGSLPPMPPPVPGGRSHETPRPDATPFDLGNSLAPAPTILSVPARRGKIAESQKLPALVAVLTVASLVQLIPVLAYGEPTAPAWMRCLLVISLLQLACWAWMILVPDWSSLWVGTIATASASVFYGFALAVAVAAPTDAPDLLEINSLRAGAQLWAVAMLVISAALMYACGQLSFQWQKSTEAAQ